MRALFKSEGCTHRGALAFSRGSGSAGWRLGVGGNSPTVTRQKPPRRDPSPHPFADSVQGSHREAFLSPVLPLAAFGVRIHPVCWLFILMLTLAPLGLILLSFLFVCFLLYFFSYMRSREKCVQYTQCLRTKYTIHLLIPSSLLPPLPSAKALNKCSHLKVGFLPRWVSGRFAILSVYAMRIHINNKCT